VPDTLWCKWKIFNDIDIEELKFQEKTKEYKGEI
jgi:hypothetical protein